MYANYNNKKVFNLDTRINWFKDNTGFWFIDHGKEGSWYKTIDLKKIQKRIVVRSFQNCKGH